MTNPNIISLDLWKMDLGSSSRIFTITRIKKKIWFVEIKLPGLGIHDR